MDNKIVVKQKKSATILTHGGNQVIRSFDVSLNNVVLHNLSERSQGFGYRQGEYFDRGLNEIVKTLEKAARCKAIWKVKA